MTSPTSPNAEDLQVQVHYRLIEALQEREHQLAEAQRLARLGSWSWDLDTGVVSCSDELRRICGLPPGPGVIDVDDLLPLLSGADEPSFFGTVRDAAARAADLEVEAPLTLADGVRWLRVHARVETDAAGRSVRMHGVARDVTEEREAARAVEESTALLEALVETTSDALAVMGADGTIGYATRAMTELLGHDPRGLDGRPLRELIHPADLSGARRSFRRLWEMPEEIVTLTLRVAHADGSWRLLKSTLRSLESDGTMRGVLLASREVANAQAAETTVDLRRDPLTGVANRALLAELSRGALERASRRGWSTAMVAVDIDDFTSINEVHGFESGDAVLVEVAARLERGFRASDAVSRPVGRVGRFVGDEFLLLCEQVEPGTEGSLHERVARLFTEPVALPVGEVHISVSVGAALSPPGAADFVSLAHEAEAALATAKAGGPGSFALFDPGGTRSGVTPGELRRELQRALDDEQLRLAFQPKVSLATGRIIGVEALLRWEHPVRGTVSPLDFIPFAEASGLIVPIGAWVIEEACRQAARWQAAFPNRPPFKVCVNVSARQFDRGLVDTVATAFDDTGLPATNFGIEVTETVLMQDAEGAGDVLAALKALGVELAIDDFGTGYSSLAYLKRFDLHELKIDKSFIDGLGEESHDTAIVAAVIALAHALDLGVVAEGVETEAQLERLRSMGCESAQGYLFSPPVSPAEIDRLLRDEASASWESRDEAVPAAPSQDPYRPDRVLIVDDSPDIRQLARMSLAAAGFEVHEADNGLAGIGLARRIRPDCILLDVMMPGTDGLEACRVLRADPATAGCTIVMLTANSDAADKVSAFSHGADDYVVKPFSPRDLTSRIQAAILRRRTEASPDTDGAPDARA